mmetsp:Transcript_16716/g.53814  ORF Transcript_16716/g.53814 Transcript_16716/m.53814 type:complete len:337 (-) Transcript_16716:100-1110(-)
MHSRLLFYFALQLSHTPQGAAVSAHYCNTLTRTRHTLDPLSPRAFAHSRLAQQRLKKHPAQLAEHDAKPRVLVQSPRRRKRPPADLDSDILGGGDAAEPAAHAAAEWEGARRRTDRSRRIGHGADCSARRLLEGRRTEPGCERSCRGEGEGGERSAVERTEGEEGTGSDGGGLQAALAQIGDRRLLPPCRREEKRSEEHLDDQAAASPLAPQRPGRASCRREAAAPGREGQVKRPGTERQRAEGERFDHHSRHESGRCDGRQAGGVSRRGRLRPPLLELGGGPRSRLHKVGGEALERAAKATREASLRHSRTRREQPRQEPLGVPERRLPRRGSQC